MIVVPVSVEITGGTAPYTFTYSSNNTNVSFSSVTGTAYLSGVDTYSASTDVEFLNQTDITSTVVTVTFVDANGCSKVLTPVVVYNPCTMQSTITNNADFVFVAATTGGSGGYTYNWLYDMGLWQIATGDSDSTDNYLSLEIKEGAVVPTSTLIAVTITDAAGCQLYKTYTYSFCQPRILSSTVSLVCDTTAVTGCTGVVSQYRNFSVERLVLPCTDQVIDWPTMEFSIPVGICVQHLGNGVLTITSSLSTNTTKIISYSVKTTSGIRSTFGTITVTIPTCEAGRNPFTGVPQTIQLTIEDIVADERLLNVESRVGGTPDWSTFAFVGAPTWGTVTFNGNRDIVYTITDVTTTPTIPDTISWTLNDYSGGQINITDTVLRNRIALPVTVLDVVCNSCGETTAPIDVLANDTGDIDRSTLYISDGDNEIVVTKDTDNNFVFTSLPGASFNNFLNYRVANTQGAYSTDAIRINVQVACVGTDDSPTLDLTCVVSKVFDIKDQFVGGNSFGDVFVETTPAVPTYASQGGVIVGAEGTVTLTGLANKTYTFQYTASNVVACSPTWDDIGVLTVIHNTTPHVTFATAVDNTNGTSTYTGTYFSNAAPFSITLNGNPATFSSGIQANGGNFTFTLYNVAGVNTVVISTISTCGVAISDSDNSLTI